MLVNCCHSQLKKYNALWTYVMSTLRRCMLDVGTLVYLGFCDKGPSRGGLLFPLLPFLAPCGLWGCKNRAHSVSWPEVVKAVPNQGVDCFVSRGSFFCFSFVFLVYVVLCLIVFGCQYQCNWLPGKTRLRYYLLCVEWDFTRYSLMWTIVRSVCLSVPV